MVLYGAFMAALLVVCVVAVLVALRFKKPATGRPPESTTPKTPGHITAKQAALMVLVVATLWAVGSLINMSLDSPGPYLIAFALGGYQYMRGAKKGDSRYALMVMVVTACLLWIWIHPHMLEAVVHAIVGPLGSVEVVRHWDGSKVSSLLNILMVVVVAWHLWVSGDFYGMLLILGVIIVLRAGFGV